MDALEFRAYDGAGADPLCGCGSDCFCWDWWTNPGCGWTGMAEAVWLRPQHTDPGTNGGTTYHHGSRFTVGYLNSCGRELRVRFFELGAPMTPNDFVNFHVIDLEYAGRFDLGCNWAGEFSVGARYADFHEGGDNESENDIDDSGGPVVGLHMKSDVLLCHTRIFANVRYAIQFGRQRRPNSDDLASCGISEIQAGFEWSKECFCCSQLFARGFAEAQNWTGDFDGSDEDLGLIGLGFAIGLTR